MAAARVLKKHGVVSIARGVVRLNAKLTGAEQKSIALLCYQRILDYNAAHP